MNSDEAANRKRTQIEQEMFALVEFYLSNYRLESCRLGRITSDADQSHLAKLVMILGKFRFEIVCFELIFVCLSLSLFGFLKCLPDVCMYVRLPLQAPVDDRGMHSRHKSIEPLEKRVVHWFSQCIQ